MDIIRSHTAPRSAILLRLLHSIVALIVLEILRIIIYFSVFLQYAFLLIAKKHSESLRVLNNGIARLAYRIMRYATLNENAKPFPFAGLPQDAEEPEDISFEN